MKAIASNIRCLAVQNFFELKNVNMTCQIFHISRASLYRFVKMCKQGESYEPLVKVQPQKFSEEQRVFLMKFIKKKQYATVSHIISAFTRKYNTSISARTVRRILKQNKYTYKQLYVKRKTAKRNIRRKRFYDKIKGISVNRFLSVDEMGFSHGPIHPNKAWCEKGKQNKISKSTYRFENYNKSIICITSPKKVINYTWINKPVNTKMFVEFLRMSLHGYSGYYLILDNVSFHRHKSVMSVLCEYGVTPVYIDPYTPEQNPIEEVFSSVKRYIRSKLPNSTAKFEKSLRESMCNQKSRTLHKYFIRSITPK